MDDDARADFLRKLDASDVSVSDWEADFIESNLQSRMFSPKQRALIEILRDKYEDRL